MPHRRTIKTGSFGGHFDGLVKHFPHKAVHEHAHQSEADAREIREKLDIHALLFERAWRLDPEQEDRN